MTRADVDFVERERRGEDRRHGTAAGARRHQQAGEQPCDACTSAKAEYDRQWRLVGDNTHRNRLHARAQQRALKQLRTLHPEEYRALYVQHKAALFAENGLS